MIKDILIVLMASMLCFLGFHSCSVERDNTKRQQDLIEALIENDNLKKLLIAKTEK